MIDYQGLTVLRYTSHQKVCQALIYLNTDNNVIKMKKTEETKTYSVQWEETVTYHRNVIASSEVEAIDIAQSNYSSEDEIESEGGDCCVTIV